MRHFNISLVVVGMVGLGCIQGFAESAPETVPAQQEASSHQGEFPSTSWLSKLLGQTPTMIELIAKPTTKLYILEDKDVYSARFGVVLCWAVFPRSSVAFAVDEVRETASATAELYERRVRAEDVALVNGGFYGLDKVGNRIPLGLVIADSKRRNEKIKWTTGGILATGAPMTIIPISKVPANFQSKSAVQSKPMLVENGKVGIRAPGGELANRSAVGLTTAGDVIVASAYTSSDQAATLFEFAEFLATPSEHGGPGAAWALAMDGGPGAHIYFPTAKRHCGITGPNYVPNLVRISRLK